MTHHTYSDEAQEDLEDLSRREHELSQIATMDAPNAQKSPARWQEQVFKMYHLTGA